MLSCYVIDDEPHAIKSLVSYIQKTPLLQLMGYEENPLDALSFFQQNNSYPDITFLDIEMPQISGMELSTLLKDKTALVLTTAHPDFAIAAFEMDINDYLLKPISFERFLKCVNKINDRLAERVKKQEHFFYIQTESKGKLIKILFEEIFYIQSQKNYVAVVTRDKKHLTYFTLTEIEERMPSAFLRINKSYVINTGKISHIEGDEVFLQNDNTGITIGPSYKEIFTQFMKDHTIKSKRL